MPKSKEYLSSSDGSDSDVERPKKKAKTVEKEKPKTEEKPKAEVKPKKKEKKAASDSEGEENRIHLGNKKFVTVREFKNRLLIDIREFYDAGGELKPGKKGISLNVENWRKLTSKIDEIDAKLEEM